MAGTEWGNPETESFGRKYLRDVRAAGGVATVHQEIVSPIARLLEGLSDAHVEIPEKVVSHDPAGTEHQRLGLAVHLPIPVPPPEEVVLLAGMWNFDGFLVEETGMVELRFMGDQARAKELTEVALAMKLDALEDPEVLGDVKVRWPGLRDLQDGDTGADVTFLRLLLNEGRDEPVDRELRQAVRRFQRRRGAPVNGLIDVDLWRRIIPAGRPMVTTADGGFIVRVVQAALAAYEGSTHRVTGTWGVLTDRDIRQLQDDYNLRRGNYVRAPEWALLLGPEIPRIEEARKASKGVGSPNAVVVVEATVPEEPKPVPVGAGAVGGYGGITSRYSAFDAGAIVAQVAATQAAFEAAGQTILDAVRQGELGEEAAREAAAHALGLKPDTEYHLTLPDGSKSVVKTPEREGNDAAVDSGSTVAVDPPAPAKPKPRSTPAKKTPARGARASSARSKGKTP